MTLKHTLFFLSISIYCSQSLADKSELAILSPNKLTTDLVLAGGISLNVSRYAGIITPEPGAVKVLFDGVTESTLNAKISLDTVQFQDNAQFESFLKNAGIREKYIEKILNQNTRVGFVHSQGCQGPRSECIVVSKGIDFVVDYYNQTIRLFVAPELLGKSVGENSYLTLNGELGIINNLSGYYYETFGRYDPTYYIRDQGVAGAGAGFIRYNIYRSDYQNNVDELYYSRALIAGNKILAGRTQSNGNFNPSSAQSLFSDISVNGIRFGTAEELVDRSYGKKTFSYYSPSAGIVEVSKDNILVYAIATQAGYGEINLANLPYGQYNALVQVKSSSGMLVSSQNVLINNTGSFNSDFSWHLFVGNSGSSDNEFVRKNTEVIESGVQLPVNTLTALYVGGAKVDKNTIYSTGLMFQKEPISISLKMGGGDQGFSHYEMKSYLERLSLSWKKTSTGKNWNELKSGTDNTTLSAGYNFNVMSNVSANVGYIYSSSMRPDYFYANTDHFGMESEFRYKKNNYSNKSLYANIYYNFLGGNSLYLNTYKELSGNDYSVSLGMNISLGKNSRFNSSFYKNGTAITNSSTVDYAKKLSDNWSHSVSVGRYFSNDSYNSATYSLSHNSNEVRGSGYYYATDNGQNQLTLTADSTQIINSGGIYFTPSSWKDNAFIIRGKDAKYDISVRNMTDNTTRYLDFDTNIISVPVYNKVMVNSDTSGSNLIFENYQTKKSRSFALVPGATVMVSDKTISTNSVIVTLKNSNNQYARTAFCNGDSCIAVSRLNQGVFRVKYTGNSLTLRSEGEQCSASEINKRKYVSITCQKI
ncbi:TcfC E-set like domain-containing protein [Escherichia coli]|uniref:TcfC E-set like domain-containing protein n=1 Tax=Escherichia coli TaxID=562 RepID=UPI0002C95283|nr:TcfC E-set like domain-containing protein [Escherichia coli]EMV36686.1 hypothetical protein EC2875000_3415 [Escherichia coli 2875000]EMV41308.1 hypothetical protein EC2872800_4996 [Escherichia coli 2872800]EMV53139.1 hypothetical protein EC2867750_4996 [Escherichia coli 2867750]EMV66128.1 hypothetical protein EC2866550_4893 [Escherichia coli 2866550]EMV79807.1 hypothetical protein EC2866750_0798 [Escherichia coli 2866750]